MNGLKQYKRDLDRYKMKQNLKPKQILNSTVKYLPTSMVDIMPLCMPKMDEQTENFGKFHLTLFFQR